MSTGRKRVRFGRIYADHLAFDEAIAEIVERGRTGRGGFVVTPNVDHVVLAEDDPRLVEAYAGAALSLVDGVPLLWLARAMGHPLPEKVSGSDLAEPLIARAAEKGVSVYFLGAKEGVGAKAAAILQERYPALAVAGVESPPLGFEKDPEVLAGVLDRVRAARPGVVLVALGCPKQEYFMSEHASSCPGSVFLGIGATLDFIAGEVQRAPPWMSRVGAEWVYRLAQEPGRMAQRYLVRDRAIIPIALRMLRKPQADRSFRVVRD